MDAMFHLVYFRIPCLLDRSTSKEVQQHTQTLDLTWSVYGTAFTAFSVYCILPSQHFRAFSTCYSTPTVLRSTTFAIMALSLMFLMATFVTTVTAMNSEETPITWTVTELHERRGTVGRGELADFCTQNSDGNQDLANLRLQSVVKLAATYSMPLIYHALRKLALNNAL